MKRYGIVLLIAVALMTISATIAFHDAKPPTNMFASEVWMHPAPAINDSTTALFTLNT